MIFKKVQQLVGEMNLNSNMHSERGRSPVGGDCYHTIMNLIFKIKLYIYNLLEVGAMAIAPYGCFNSIEFGGVRDINIKGFSKRNLEFICKWYLYYSQKDAITKQLVSQFVLIFKKGRSPVGCSPRLHRFNVCQFGFVGVFMGKHPTNFYFMPILLNGALENSTLRNSKG